MIFNPRKHKVLANYLSEVRKSLEDSSRSQDEVDGICEDLAAQINSMLQSEKGEITEDVQYRILESMDPPEKYVEMPRLERVSFGDRETATNGGFRWGLLCGWLIALVIISAIGWLALYLFKVRNNIIDADEYVDSSYAQVETALQRRYDLIPNLVEVVKGVAKHEKVLITEVTKLRSQWGAAKNRDDQIKTANQLEGALSKLLLVTESYPDVKAAVAYTNLQFQLEGTENRISIERNRYNSALRHYNASVKKFPGSLFQFEPTDTYFESVEGAETAPKISL